MAHKQPSEEQPVTADQKRQGKGAPDETRTEDPERLRSLLQETQEEAKRNLDSWKRAAADFANYRRRQEAEREELATYAKAAVVGRVLPVLDDFERALANLPHSLAHLTWTEGVFLIERKLRATLESEGLKPIEAEGQVFDPRYHEAVLYEPSAEVPEGQVIGELQTGYLFNGRVLRPTMVRVSRGEAGDKGEAEGKGSTEVTGTAETEATPQERAKEE